MGRFKSEEGNLGIKIGASRLVLVLVIMLSFVRSTFFIIASLLALRADILFVFLGNLPLTVVNTICWSIYSRNSGAKIFDNSGTG